MILAVVVVVSGCASVTDSAQPDAKLIGQVSDNEITDSSPGEIKLNAMNYRNETSFRVNVRPLGDYSNLVRVTDRDGEEVTEVDLGSAVKEATTRERYVEVRKRLNVTSNVKVKAELHNSTSEEPLDTKIYNLRAIED